MAPTNEMMPSFVESVLSRMVDCSKDLSHHVWRFNKNYHEIQGLCQLMTVSLDVMSHLSFSHSDNKEYNITVIL